jgi:predicted ribosomally synthesized peptide with nif11-like leader
MKNLTPEMIEKAKAAKSAEELLALAKESGVEMTADEAATYFAQLNPKSGELNDDDLDSVAGGACSSNSDVVAVGTIVRVTSGQTCKNCGGNIGKVTDVYALYGPIPGVVCDNCSVNGNGYNIVNYINECTYEIIG